MFPTFDVPPQHAETVGARKARRAREGERSRRDSTSTAQSTGSSRSGNADGKAQSTETSSRSSTKTAKKSGFGGLFRSKNKEIQEIPTHPSLKISSPQERPITPLPSTDATKDWTASFADTFHSAEIQPTSRRPAKKVDDHVRPPSHEHRFSQGSELPHSQKIIPPPLGAFPSPPPPPTGALPRPPSPGVKDLRGQHVTDLAKSRTSAISHACLTPTTASSSGRSAYSRGSVFSSFTTNNSVFSEESFLDDDFVDKAYYGLPASSQPDYDPHLTSNVQLEPVEPRSVLRQGGPKSAQGTFARALAKMESASSRIISTRLNEEWEGLDDDDESYQEIQFEKRLWALTAYQRLTQNKHLQSPAHEMLNNSSPADQRKILHLHGSLADGWMLAAKYPAATVYTTSSVKSGHSPTTYPAPLNHHTLYVPSLAGAMPFPDGYFDAIISRSISTVLRDEEWARVFFDCTRVLKPGGQIEILSVDPHLSSERQRLSEWADDTITSKLDAHGISNMPSDTVLDTFDIVGLGNIRRARVALPAHLGAPKLVNQHIPPSRDTIDTSKMMGLLGRHFYQDLYGRFLHQTQGEEWFWARPDISDECERFQTKMVLTITCAQKLESAAVRDSYISA